MNEPPEIAARERKRRNWPATIALWSLVLIVLYVLSVGPVLWLRDHQHWPPDKQQAIIGTYYQPLMWAMHYFGWFKEFVTWYCGFWTKQ